MSPCASKELWKLLPGLELRQPLYVELNSKSTTVQLLSYCEIGNKFELNCNKQNLFGLLYHADQAAGTTLRERPGTSHQRIRRQGGEGSDPGPGQTSAVTDTGTTQDKKNNRRTH